jgi:Ca-activated chloride channel family protein
MLATEPRITEGTLQTIDGRPLPLEWTRIEANVQGPLAQVQVRQCFRNPTSETLEATYLFPLPHQASVYGMEFRIGERVVRGVVKEKEEARRSYEAARSEGRAATLLEQERPNLFTLSVANIAPGASIEVLLEYQESVAFDYGQWRFVFPMVASERYHSPESAAGEQSGSGSGIRPPRARSTERTSPLSLQLHIEQGSAMEAPTSPSHPLQVERAGDGYRVSLSQGQAIPNCDFVLVWAGPKGGGALAPQVWFDRKMDKPGTFCVCLPAPILAEHPAPSRANGKGIGCGNCGAPMESKEAVEEVPGFGHAWRCEYCGVYHRVEAPPSEATCTGKDVVFLVDLSASMKGLGATPKVIDQALSMLEEKDAFKIIGFHHELLVMSYLWSPCDAPSRARAAQFLADLRSRGGTELEAALKEGARDQRPRRARVVVLLTDGAVGNEGRLLRMLPGWLGDARLYVLGMGPACNRYLIDKLALHGRGAYDVAVTPEPEVIERFARRIAEAGPVLTGLTIELVDGTAMDLYPRGPQELFSGQVFRLTGRFMGSGPAVLRLLGTTREGEKFRQEISLVLPEYSEQTPGLERVWARQRIEDLQDQLTRRPEQLSEIRMEVLGLALKHQLMSPYTALVAEDTERAVDPSAPSRRVEVELAGPAAPAQELEGLPECVESAPEHGEDFTDGWDPSPASSRPASVAAPESYGGWLSDEVPSPAPSMTEMVADSIAREALTDEADSWVDEEMMDYDDDACVVDCLPPQPRKGLVAKVSEAITGRFSKPTLGADKPKLGRAVPPESPSPGRPAAARAEVRGEAFSDSLPDPDHDASRRDLDLFGGDDPFAAPLTEMHDPFADPPSEPEFPDLFGSTDDVFGGASTWHSEPVEKSASWGSKKDAREYPPTDRQVRGQTPIGSGRPPRVTYPPDELFRALAMVKGHLDLVFLIDETGSMGPYIMEVQEQLFRLIEALRQSPLCRRLRLGLVTFRDHPPQDNSFVTRVMPLTENVPEISRAVERMRADGGGDGPEAVTDGLHELLNLDWDQEAARMVVMVGDAPPHGVEPSGDGFPDGCPCGRHWYTQVESCREMGVTIHSVGCQGIAAFKGAEQVFQTVALGTGGLYMPLAQAWLLIDLVTGLADRELDRQRLEQYVAEIYAAQRAALERADFDEQVRFISETLEARKLEVLDLINGPGKPPTFRPVRPTDVELALQSVLRRSPVLGRAIN